jgi:hypothetical protein
MPVVAEAVHIRAGSQVGRALEHRFYGPASVGSRPVFARARPQYTGAGGALSSECERA